MPKIIITLLVAFFISSNAQIVKAQETIWEYKAVPNASQPTLDELGKTGWELIGAIPTPSGMRSLNEQFRTLVFKRRFNFERSQREAVEEEKRAKEAQAKFEEEKRSNELREKINEEARRNSELIDLDSIESQQLSNKGVKEEKARLEKALANIKDIPFKIIGIESYFMSEGKIRTRANIVIDGTSKLLKDNNKYRSSEAKTFLQQSANEIYNQLDLQNKYGQDSIVQYESSDDGIYLGVSLNINVRGNPNAVGSLLMHGFYTAMANK